MTRFLFLQQQIDPFEIVFVENTGSLFQAQSLYNGIVAGLCEIAARHENLLLSVEDVDIDANAHFIPQFVGLER